MREVVLLHQDDIQHYRVPIYNHLSKYLYKNGYHLTISSENIEKDSLHPVYFNFKKNKLNTLTIIKFLMKVDIDAVIFFINLKNLYLFPVILFLKLKGIKIIYWGHGIDLQDKNNKVKNLAYRIEHRLFDAILLYADHLKKYIATQYYNKVFIANNTLNTTVYDNISPDTSTIKARYGIKTTKNIICMGRMQKRKRVEDLVKAFRHLKTENVGLILAGPDIEDVLKNIEHDRIYKLGSVYGEDAIKLLMLSDIYCMPGHVGLSIVDAFYCGLPFVTEDVAHAPEIMYLKNGKNGYVVDRGDVRALAAKLDLLLTDRDLCNRMAANAKNEISSNGHIDTMCKGFVEALSYVLGGRNG